MANIVEGDTNGIDPELAYRMLEFEKNFVTNNSTIMLNSWNRMQEVMKEFPEMPHELRYHQLLARLLDSPGALQHDPVTVNRLNRIKNGEVSTL